MEREQKIKVEHTVSPVAQKQALYSKPTIFSRKRTVIEESAPSAQTAKVNAPSSVVTNLEASAVRDYVTAHRQISGPSNVRPASFGAPR